MVYFKKFISGSMSSFIIFFTFGALYFFWASEKNLGDKIISFNNWVIFFYKTDPLSFGFGNIMLLICIFLGIINMIPFSKLIKKGGDKNE